MVDDVLRFLVIFFVVLAAFACGTTQIYHTYNPTTLSHLENLKYCQNMAIQYQNKTRYKINECHFVHLAKMADDGDYSKLKSVSLTASEGKDVTNS